MRLTGYACRHPEPPLRKAYLPLGELTVLIGPNDSGKSSLLRAAVRDLQGGHFGQGKETDKLIGGVFYAEVSSAELAALIRTSEGGRRRSGFSQGYKGARPPFDEGLWSPSLEMDDLKDEAIATVWSALSQRQTDTGEARDVILAALRESTTVAIECAGRAAVGERLVWNIYWCLPPADQLGQEVLAALTASDLQPFKRQRERAEGQSGITRGMYEVFHGRPTHLWVGGAPICIVSFGMTTQIPMPTGLAVPADFTALHAAVRESATALINRAVYAISDATLDGEEDLTSEDRARRYPPRAWLAENDGWVGLSEDAIATFHFVSAATNRRLPDFLRDRYELDVFVADVDKWFSSEPIRLIARPRNGGSLFEEFPVEEVAEGFRLWFQLALLNALEDAGRVESLLGLRASDWYDHALAGTAGPDGEPDPDELEAADEAERRFQDVRAALRDLEAGNGEWVSGELEATLAAVPGDDWTRGGTRERRVFVVDEPERHLHPRLQRQAAAWLARTATASRAPLLVATHSPAFLSLPAEAATYISVHRTAEELRLESFDAADLDALSGFSTEMGYDRGELISAVSVWLVVEGATDKAVLETLYDNELRQAGIEVVPLHGTAKWQALLDADALWRFTNAPIAVRFDRISEETVDALASKSDDELQALSRSGSEPNEVKDMAKLIRSIQGLGRRVYPVPSEGADILVDLDEESIRTVFPDYPSHEEAQAAWERHDKGTIDAFLKRKFGVEKSPDAFAAIAHDMATKGKLAPALEAAIDCCRKLGE